MKHLFLITLLGLTVNIFASGGREIKQLPKHQVISHAFVHENRNYSFDKNRIELVYKTPHYNTPFYIYKNQFRISITEGVKFWIDYNDFTFLQKAAEDKASKYRARVSGTFRIRLPW